MYRAHGRAVYGFLLRELRDPHDAEDATQTVFVDALRSVRRGRLPHAPRAWLLAIARNAARRTWRERLRGAAAEIDPDTLADTGGDAAARRELVHALAAIPEPQRRALVLHELGGLAYSEIAQATGQTVAGVETAIFRARERARAQARGDGAFDHDRAARLLPRLVAGKLTRAEREAVQAHVARCAACAEEERTLRSARRRRGLFGWLSLPDLVGRLTALLQAGSAGKLAVAVAAGAALGGGVAASTTDIDRTPRAPAPAVEAPTRVPDAAARPEPALRPRPARPAPHPARAAPHAQAPVPVHPATRTPLPSVDRRPAAPPPPRPTTTEDDAPRTSSDVPPAAPRPTPTPPRPSPTVDTAPAAPEPAASSPSAAPADRQSAPGPLAAAVQQTVEDVANGVGQATDALLADVDAVGQAVNQTTEGVADTVETLTGAAPGTSPAVPLPPALQKTVADVGAAAAAVVSGLKLPPLRPPGAAP